MLHIVNKSPLERPAFASCLRVAQPDSAVLLIEDGVYAATRGTAAAKELARHRSMKFYALGPDLEARGVRDRLVDGVQVVDYEGFVDLVAAHPAVQSWL